MKLLTGPQVTLIYFVSWRNKFCTHENNMNFDEHPWPSTLLPRDTRRYRSTEQTLNFGALTLGTLEF